MAEAREIIHNPDEGKSAVESNEELQGKAFAASELLKGWVPSALNGYKETPLSKIEEALSVLVRFKDAVAKDRAKKQEAKNEMRKRIEEVLNTPRGAAVQKARDVFVDFDGAIIIPYNDKAHASEYSISTTDNYLIKDIDLDDEDYDSDAVFEFQMGHLQDWGDGEIDHGGGYTRVVIKLDTDGKIVYEFSGEELDAEFKKQIEDLIRKKAEEI
ncbi:MAG: hypothetical protein Q7S16_05165 [bacterium]|nr:hypothetical protein [bacterium]